MTVWRTRLDTTSHWAFILSIGLTTFALGSPATPHYIMLLALAFNMLFMILEGRRYQHLHHSKWRLNLIEHNHFGTLMDRAGQLVEPTWRDQLAHDLRRPHLTLSLVMGTRLRLRRNYLLLIYFITAVWIAKLFIHPSSPGSFMEFYRRLAVGDFLPSWFVLGTAIVFIVGVTALAALTPDMEVLERRSVEQHFRRHAARTKKAGGPPASGGDAT